MADQSPYLDSIIDNQNQIATLQVVFCDIVSYSRRRSQNQASVVDAFTSTCKAALAEISAKYTAYFDKNGLVCSRDAVAIPTGDGAAFAFPFEGIHDLHLSFAESLIRLAFERTANVRCEKFEDQSWCNCHDYFKLTVGISEGKGIVYRDINGNYNVAGSPVNISARVMGQADGNQILLSAEAYRTLLDFVDDPSFDEHFREYKNVRVKHGTKLTVYQCIRDVNYLNRDEPRALRLIREFDEVTALASKIGFPFPSFQDDHQVDPTAASQLFLRMSTLVKSVEKIKKLSTQTSSKRLPKPGKKPRARARKK